MSGNREEHPRYWLVARDKPGLLIAVMRALAGNAHISFEGDLSHCDFSSVAGASVDETECLRRCTLTPQLDFVVCPLEPETIKQILSEVLPEGRVVHQIIHIQIERDGEIAFGAYDNFHPECIVAWPGVPGVLLEQLKASGVLRSFDLART
jgi:(2Fe-2S) ferredoxin